MLSLKLINEINGPQIRGMVKNDLQIFSIYDFLNTSNKKPCDNAYGRTLFNRQIKDGSEHKDEIESLTIYVKFPGQGKQTR